MDRIAVVGDHDSIYGFAALGLDVFPCSSEEARELIIQLSSRDYGIIYVTEKLAQEIPAVIDHFREQLKPAIILIPGASGNTGAGVMGVRKSVEQAVGSDILFSNN